MRTDSFLLFKFFKMFTNGLWSVHIIKFFAPKKKALVLCNAHLMAANSPLMAAYLDSAGEQKAEPTIVILQPDLQQSNFSSSQAQYFCRSQKPILVWLQSVSNVGILFRSKFWILSTQLSAIFFLICLNTMDNWESQ